MYKAYKVSGIISVNDVDYTIEGNLKFDKKGQIVRPHDEDSKVTILPGKYYINANAYGKVLRTEKGLALMLEFPQEFKTINYASLNGSTLEDLSGEYVGLLKSFSAREHSNVAPFFNQETDNPNSTLKLEKIVNYK